MQKGDTMLNNTLMEAILLSGSLRRRCYTPERELIPARPRPPLLPSRDATPARGITINMGGFSVNTGSGTVTYNTDGAVAGGFMVFG
jgi:hypothetical protein